MILNKSQPRVTNWWFGFMIKQKCPSIYLNKQGPEYDLFLDCGLAWVRDDKCGAHGQWSAVVSSGQLGGDNGPETGDSHTPALITRHTQGHQKLSRIRKNEQAAEGCRKMTPGNYTDQMSIPVLTQLGKIAPDEICFSENERE